MMRYSLINGYKLHNYLQFLIFIQISQIFRINIMGCDQSDIVAFNNMMNANDSDQEQPNKPKQIHPEKNKKNSQTTFAQQPPQQTYPPQGSYGQGPQTYQQPYQQPIQSYGQPPQSYPPQQPVYHSTALAVGTAPPKPAQKKTKIHRQQLQKQANYSDDFMTHHLKYELSLTKFVSKKRIIRRQILEHMILQSYWGNVGKQGVTMKTYFESLDSAWMQRTFLQIWQVAHDQFFNQHVEEKLVRRKIAEQYMFEIYELKQYVDAGLGTINAFVEKTRCSMTEFMQFSDDSLFHIFRKLKDRYPQTGQTQKIEFPDVPSTQTKMNLLENFPSKCFSDPASMNIQTIFYDVSFMLKKAIEEQDAFKQDMKLILGDDVLACPKVSQVNKDGKMQFNACAVRRVFIKWAQNILEKCPDLLMTNAFTKFIRAKSQIMNNFYFKSTIQPTTHKIVIDIICYLLEVAKFTPDNKKRPEFIFNIYDLLRCKIKRNSADDVVKLLRNMQATKVTKNGKKFQVIRVKNRFKTNNRDLLINFRYGDVLVGEAQLCIDDANVSKTTKLNYQFCHYIYELERSLFGPTLQLMMQYEDFQRPDITMSFEAEDRILPRKDQRIKNASKTDRKCIHGHEMVSLIKDFVFGEQSQTAVSFVCKYCDSESNTDKPYDYCFHCGCIFCKNCIGDYKKANSKQFWLSVQRQDLTIFIKDEGHLKSQIQKHKALIVMFHHEGISASQVLKDAFLFHQSKLTMQPKKYIPKLAFANYSNATIKQFCDQYEINEFPVTLLFNGQGTPVRSIIGCSWVQFPLLFETQKRMLNNQSYELQVNCASCKEQMNFTQLQEGSQGLVCLNCFNNAKPINMPQQYHSVGAFCSQKHYRCIQCCYTALDVPTYYKDPTGQNYLSSTFINPQLKKCPKGHNVTYTKKNLLDVWEYQCFGCKQKMMFDDQNGVGICVTCKVGLCPRCMGCRLLNLKELDSEHDIALHYVESTAQEGCACSCKRLFKKVYNTRALSMQQAVNEHNEKKWTCTFCQKVKKEGQLHLACFKCPDMSKVMGKDTNFQICIDCAQLSQILKKEAATKVAEDPSFFICRQGHNMVKTSLAYNEDLSFNCQFCKQKYYANTQRMYCKTCQTNCCKGCLKMLLNANPPRCNQYCPQKHYLSLQYSTDTLKFCDGCIKVLKQDFFDCQPCGYALCSSCSSKPPGFIGTAFDDCKKGLLKKKMGDAGQIQQQGTDVKSEQSQQASPNYNQMYGQGYQQQQQSQNVIDQLLEWGFD